MLMIGLFFLGRNKPTRLIHYGKPVKRYTLSVEQRLYDIEVVAFTDYHQALHYYFKIVPEIQSLGKLLETNADFLDWTNGLMRFEEFTLKLVREVNKIRLIKSHHPISFELFEQDLQQLAEQFK